MLEVTPLTPTEDGTAFDDGEEVKALDVPDLERKEKEKNDVQLVFEKSQNVGRRLGKVRDT